MPIIDFTAGVIGDPYVNVDGYLESHPVYSGTPPRYFAGPVSGTMLSMNPGEYNIFRVWRESRVFTLSMHVSSTTFPYQAPSSGMDYVFALISLADVQLGVVNMTGAPEFVLITGNYATHYELTGVNLVAGTSYEVTLDCSDPADVKVIIDSVEVAALAAEHPGALVGDRNLPQIPLMEQIGYFSIEVPAATALPTWSAPVSEDFSLGTDGGTVTEANTSFTKFFNYSWDVASIYRGEFTSAKYHSTPPGIKKDSLDLTEGGMGWHGGGMTSDQLRFSGYFQIGASHSGYWYPFALEGVGGTTFPFMFGSPDYFYFDVEYDDGTGIVAYFYGQDGTINTSETFLADGDVVRDVWYKVDVDFDASGALTARFFRPGDITPHASFTHTLTTTDIAYWEFSALPGDEVFIDDMAFSYGGVEPPTTPVLTQTGNGLLTLEDEEFGFPAPEYRLQILDPIIERGPGVVTFSVSGGLAETDVQFFLDGDPDPIWETTLDSSGALTPSSVGIYAPGGADVGTHTLEARQQLTDGTYVTTSATYEVLYSPYVSIINAGPDMDPVEIPGAVTHNTRHWVLQDLYPVEQGGIGSYILPVNPSDMTSPHWENSFTSRRTLAKSGQFHVFQAGMQTVEWRFSGYAPSQEMVEKLMAYRGLNRRFYLIDHHNRAWKVVFVNVDLKARLRHNFNGVLSDWGHDYEVTALITEQEWKEPV